MAPMPVTYEKLASFAASLIVESYSTANDYVSAVRVFAKTQAQWSLSAAQELTFDLSMKRMSAKGLFKHSPATPIILSDFLSSRVLTQCKAVALFVFYFGLRKKERFKIDMIEDVKVEGPKITLDLTPYVLKSNHTKVIAVYCICTQLKECHPDGEHICPCRVVACLKRYGSLALQQIQWEEILDEMKFASKIHAFRIGTLHHLIANEASLGWACICNHLRWAGVQMLLYYMRQRANTRACSLRKINFLAPVHEQDVVMNRRMLDKINIKLDKLMEVVSGAFVKTENTLLGELQRQRIDEAASLYLGPSWPAAPVQDGVSVGLSDGQNWWEDEIDESAYQDLLTHNGENLLPIEEDSLQCDGVETPLE
jgi:hypothetical protein